MPEYKCEECSKAFGSERSLKEHMNQAHPEVVEAQEQGRMAAQDQGKSANREARQRERPEVQPKEVEQ